MNDSSTDLQVYCFGGAVRFGTVELTESRTLASSKVPKDTAGTFGGVPKSGMGLVTVRGAFGATQGVHVGAASS